MNTASTVSLGLQRNLAADGNSLNDLKALAGKDEKAALKETAKQFEALFMRELLKSMREATMKSGLLDNEQGDLGTDLLDQQYATQMTGLPGGLSEMIEIGEASGAKAAPIILAHSLRIVFTITLIAFWFRIVQGASVGGTLVALSADLAAGDAISQYRGWKKGQEPEPERIVTKRKAFNQALESGVKICMGGDVGVFNLGCFIQAFAFHPFSDQ